MQPSKKQRREFLKRAGSPLMTALPAGFATSALGQAAQLRQDWNSFAMSEDYASFINGIARMRAITNSADPRGWTYWSRVYAQQAALGTPYFLAWNRGLLRRFENQLRAVTGNPRLRLPYWDCFRDPDLPWEFTEAESWNPLYVPRASENVCSALSMAPFAPDVTNMQQGLPGAFESVVERLPHNALHNLLGNAMAGMQAPEDPIFWLHQANLDRLWSGWMLAVGKNVPAAGDPYWSALLSYGDAERAMAQTDDAGVRYADLALPASLPVSAPMLSRPNPAIASRFAGTVFTPLGSRVMEISGLPTSGLRVIDASHIALASARRIALSEASATLELLLAANASALLRSVLLSAPTDAGLGYRSAQIVLDDLQLFDQGACGGYYYALFLNLPATIDAATSQSRHMLGTVGAFEIAAARQRMQRGLAATVRIDFAATTLLKRLASAPGSNIAISFCRVNGTGAVPSGDVIGIGELRLECSNAPSS